MILIFLGSLRATSAVLLSIPLSALATFVVLALMGSTINTMILGGLALAFSRVIDNSVISLENIYRHLEMGAAPAVAAEIGGAEVNLAVLAATLVDVVDFFPVVFLYGVGKFLFSALALAFCLSLLASFVVAMTVIPLFCSRFLKSVPHAHGRVRTRPVSRNLSGTGSTTRFNRGFDRVLDFYEACGARRLKRPGADRRRCWRPCSSRVSPSILSLAWLSSRRPMPASSPSTSKLPTGTRIEFTNEYVAKVEDLIRHIVSPGRFQDGGFQYRRGARFFLALHHQCRTVHRHHPGAAQRRSQDQQLRIHGPGSGSDRRGSFPKSAPSSPAARWWTPCSTSGMPAPIDVQVASSQSAALLTASPQDLAAASAGCPAWARFTSRRT